MNQAEVMVREEMPQIQARRQQMEWVGALSGPYEIRLTYSFRQLHEVVYQFKYYNADDTNFLQ